MGVRTAARRVVRIARDAIIVDRWSNLSHKAPMRDDIASRAHTQVAGWAPASWVGEDHFRRLQAYIVLDAYRENVSREFLQASDDNERQDRREYGDAALIVKTVHNALLGDTVAVQVPGAERYDPELDADDNGDVGTEDDVDTERLAENAAARALADMQDRLQRWADAVHLELRMVDCENNAVGMGDGVYLMGWDAERRRPVPAVMNPGFYFPVLPDAIDSYEYPTRVHFAWEIPPVNEDDEPRVRRITYELVDLAPVWDDLADMMGEDPWVIPDDAKWRTLEGDADGVRFLVRDYPWNEEPSRKTVIMSDGTWTLTDLKDAATVDEFPDEQATWRLNDQGDLDYRVDMGIDFIPVVHIPNTPPGGEHFGKSSLSDVVQILDDLQSADTDLSLSSATTGSPIIVVKNITGMGAADDSGLLSGRRPEQREVRPGAVWTGDGATVIDTSAQLAALGLEIDALRDRLGVNAQVPGTILGTIKPSEVSSGFHMQLTFGPLVGMIRMMRLVRAVKYPLLLKMAQRFYQINDPDQWPAGPSTHATIQFGAFMPTDQKEVMELVAAGVEHGVLSLETGLQMLQAVGFPLDDVADEVERIQSRDYEGANRLADATADQDAVREYLHLKKQPEQETVPDPAAGGTGTGAPSPTDSGA